MKKILAFLLSMVLLLSAVPFVSALDPLDGQRAAENLHALGLLAGVGKNADGSVNFDVGGKLTRAQAITQIVRFLGAEKTATASAYTHPFTDLPAWAVPYVGYAFENGITKGVSATKFGTDDRMGDAAFLTLILRVLGYDDSKGDFVWNNPYTLAKTAGLVESEAADGDFTRGDAFVICYRALTAAVKSGDSIKTQLIAKGVFTEAQYGSTVWVPTGAKLMTVGELNTVSVRGSHAEDAISTASLEINYRENVVLTSAVNNYTRYDNAWYPRVKKVNDNLYVLFFMYGQFGRHIYWTYSSDGINWEAPQVFWGATNDKKFIHTDGPLKGSEDQYLAVNADLCVLDNGDILCVYAVRPSSGYSKYLDLNSIRMMRGTVSADNKITWGEETILTKGQAWEPFIWQREDGTVEIYWSNAAPQVSKYGFDEEKRSTGTSMIYSKDNGFTWAPDMEDPAKDAYLYHRVYQEYIGDKVPFGDYTEAVPYYGGQMPSATALYNGKTLLAVEVNGLPEDGNYENGSNVFYISLATSGEGGAWKDLAFDEVGPDTLQTRVVGDGAAPYLATFPSGEVYLTYNADSRQNGRLISPDGQTLDDKVFYPTPAAKGSWGATELVGSHKVLSTFPSKDGDIREIHITASYLNHRINAKRASIKVDSDVSDWAMHTDALFVGSESQAQMTVQVAHDAENVYFLISRLDKYLTAEDTVTLHLGTGFASFYRVELGMDGISKIAYIENAAEQQQLTGGRAIVKTFGTVGDNTDTDEGVSIEVSIPKSILGSAQNGFTLSPALTNRDGEGSIYDGLTGVSVFNTLRWPAVVLE